ncbi:MAG TPA: flagellar export chaperone FliS [Acidimicrobiales bacterium]|nr:flagellar export chaperone FliS [Acidimicrobiales bacterium]
MTAPAEELALRYLAEAIETATPAVRLTMLYDRLELDLRRAEVGFEQGDLKAISDNLIHAQEILLALRTTLREGVWDGAARLAALYDFLHGELLQANLAKDRTKLTGATELIAQLSQAWREAAAGSAGAERAMEQVGGAA